nr:hypothetical protein [uncultured Duganella sp.]
MLKKLQLDALKADLAAVNDLLTSRSRAEDPIGFLQYSSRKNSIEREIASIGSAMDNHAELGIFFGGGPVQGSRGINADFAGKALEDIQTLISKHFSGKEIGPLKKTGPLPLNDYSQMLVTDVVRGSFGFVLSEAGDTIEMIGTPLKDVVDEVSDILSRIGANDEEIFDEAAAQLDERILVTMKQLFQRLDEHGATMRVVQGDRDFLLNRDAVALARSRVKELEISETVVEHTGRLFMLPDSRRFDLYLNEDGQQVVIKGPVGASVVKQLSGQLELDEDPIDVTLVSSQPWLVELKRREIKERNRQPRFVYTLSRLKHTVEIP